MRLATKPHRVAKPTKKPPKMTQPRPGSCVYPIRYAEPIDPPYVPSPDERGLDMVCYGPRSKATKIYGAVPDDPTAVYGTMPSQYCGFSGRDVARGCVAPAPAYPEPKTKRPPMTQAQAARYAAVSYANYAAGCCKNQGCTGCRQYLTGQPYAAYSCSAKTAEQNGGTVLREATVAQYPAAGGNCDRGYMSFSIMPSKRSAPAW